MMISGHRPLARWSNRLLKLGLVIPLLQFGGCSPELFLFQVYEGFVQAIAAEIFLAAQGFFTTALGGQAGV
jgi:hypothetical protein